MASCLWVALEIKCDKKVWLENSKIFKIMGDYHPWLSKAPIGLSKYEAALK